MEYKLDDKVYHSCDTAPFIVTAIAKDKLRIKGDWSGGTNPEYSCEDWVNIDDVKPYDETKVTYYLSGKPYRNGKRI